MVPGAVLRVEAVAGVVAAPGCTVVADHSGQVILTLQHISVGYVYYIQWISLQLYEEELSFLAMFFFFFFLNK